MAQDQQTTTPEANEPMSAVAPSPASVGNHPEVSVAAGNPKSSGQRSASVSSSSFRRLVVAGMSTAKVNYWLTQLREVNKLEERCMSWTESQLRKETRSLKYRAKSGEPLSDLLPETYALIREAGRRALQMRHYDVQIVGGLHSFTDALPRCRRGKGRRSRDASSHIA